MFCRLILLCALSWLVACSPKTADPIDSNQSPPKVIQANEPTNIAFVSIDSHSFSNPQKVQVNHIELDLTVNFDNKTLSGTAQLTFERIVPNATLLIVDTRDLTIHEVSTSGNALKYTLADADEHLGAALSIELPKNVTQLSIRYSTSPKATGLQWLTPAQTAGKIHPFLFTQAQAIHARSFIPLQDSPQVRITYDATIRTPPELLAVMSAANDPNTARDGIYEFHMPQSIPSYLIALAVGDLQFKPMGERTGVYSEAYILDAAANEFADTENMLIATEKIYGPYRWDRYDLLILPPSFPFGGMENPRLSFITPTVIAGDKSLVSLIAHELAHSWSGNTVTNATWRDLWLNEGFTTYLTYRIMELVYGSDRYNMEAVLGYQDLQEDLDNLEDADEILAIDLKGRDPDDVFSNIPYEKGALFLREIENKVGRANFDQFLLEYFEHFAFKSITTDAFLDYLNVTLISAYPDLLSAERINQWVFAAGIPEAAPVPQSNVFTDIDALRDQWLAGNIAAKDINTQNWVFHQWQYFLRKMPTQLSEEQLLELDAAFELTDSGNNEIVHTWLLMCIQNWHEPAFERLHSYLTSIGRNKLVKPLYEALSKTPEGKKLAQAAFTIAKASYHPLTVKVNQGFVE